MRGGVLPPAILCAMLGLLLAFVPLRQAFKAAALMAAVALATLALASITSAPQERWIEPIFIGCWLSVIALGLLVVRPERVPPALVFAAAANSGLWAAAVTVVTAREGDLAIALPCVLTLLLGHALLARGWSMLLKILASWLTAVAMLATMVSFTQTPGYLPDHME